MVGIFENYEKLELEEMRFEVALFKAISVSNYANEVKTLAQNKGTKLINKVSGLVKAKGVDEIQVQTVEELVAEECEELKYATKEELHDEMVCAVKDKLVEIGMSELDLDTEEKVAFYAIKEAENAISGGVGQEASIAQKADDVALNFTKKQIKELKGNISKNKQNRDLLAHFIWKVSVHNDPYFPNGLEEEENEASLDEEFRNLLKDKTNYEQREKDIEVSITSTEYKITGDKASIADLESKIVFVDKRVKEFEEKSDEEKNSADAASARRVKEITETEIKTKKDDLAMNEEKLESLHKDKDALAKEKEEKAEKEKELAAKLVALLKTKWSNHLLGVVISDAAIEHLINVYSLKDRKILESALIEIGSSSNPSLLAEGDNADGSEVFSFVIGKRAIGRILFVNDNGVVDISDIYKVKQA